MDSFAELLALAPQRCRAELERHRRFPVEEMRLRIGQAPTLLYGGREHPLELPEVQEADIVRILQKASNASLYRAAEALRRGYCCCGSLRLGVCGRAAAGQCGTGFSSYSSLAIRLSRDCGGVCAGIADRLMREGFDNTLILSPPGGGKTTALRDLVRQLSGRGLRIGVIDERGELSAAVYDLGARTDVISGTDKLSGALLLLRSMTPQVIAADEISAPEDVAAAEKIFGCGTGLIATAHAEGVEDLRRRRVYRDLIAGGVFRRAVTIRSAGGERRYAFERIDA